MTWTKERYAQYQQNVHEFLLREGLEDLTTDFDEETGDVAEPHFSWSPCDCCRSPLGGDRYKCSGYNYTLGEVQMGYSLCVDCVYYMAYGRLDDQSMMEIANETPT